MLGVDLAILGQQVEVYDAYAQAVRIEYAHVADSDYRAGRQAILQQFARQAAEGTLYAHPWFAELYTLRALDNLRREIAALA